MLSAALLALCIAAPVFAQVTPLAPAPGDVSNEGSTCHIAWQADSTGKWTTMAIEFMTGNNFDMVHLTTVVTLDGTDATKTTFDWPCPSVTPNAAEYFYQFSSPADPTTQKWTGRFAIADASGHTVPPTNSTQPDGSAIPWGTGALTDPSTASAPPAWLSSETTGSNSTSTNSTSSSATSTSSGFVTSTASPTGTPASGNALNTEPSGSASNGNITTSSSGSSPSQTANSAHAMIDVSSLPLNAITFVLGAIIACVF